MSGCSSRALVQRHFAGTIGPRDERAMREHLPGCVACTDLYRRHLLFSRLDPGGLAAEERIARGLGLRPRGHPAAIGVTVMVCAAAAAFVLVALRPTSPNDGSSAFSARGRAVEPAAVTSRVFLYRVGREGPAVPVADAVKSDDELAFAYENGAGKRRLAIFGVDDARRVYWFFPAWASDAEDPVAIPIVRDADRHELPDAVRHRFTGSRLEVRSVFLDEPVSVRAIEALVERDPASPLPIPGAVERSVSLRVEP